MSISLYYIYIYICLYHYITYIYMSISLIYIYIVIPYITTYDYIHAHTHTCVCVSVHVCLFDKKPFFFERIAIAISPISLGNSTATQCFPAAEPLLATVFVTVVVDRVPPQLLLRREDWEDWNCVGSPVSSADLPSTNISMENGHLRCI